MEDEKETALAFPPQEIPRGKAPSEKELGYLGKRKNTWLQVRGAEIEGASGAVGEPWRFRVATLAALWKMDCKG